MKWTIVEKESAISNKQHLYGDPTHWSVGYEDGFILVLKCEAENAGEVGKFVGINQTLLSSQRVSTYGEAGHDGGVVTLSLALHQPAPCLNGHPDFRPFYDGRGAARPLPAVGQSVQLELRDDPLSNVAEHVIGHVNGKAMTKSITQFHCRDKFLISLIEFDGKHKPAASDTNAWNDLVKAQWEWGYDYTLVPTPNAPTRPESVASHVDDIKEVPARSARLVANGPPAESNPPQFVSNPPGWRDAHGN